MSNCRSVSLSAVTKRALWASAGGYCQNPGCRADLIQLSQNGDVTNLDELAHIVARKAEGPRGKDPRQVGRDTFENIIILCPRCHSLVDKNPNQYPTDLLLKWKAEHISTIQNAFAPIFKTRGELGGRTHEILRRNKAIFDEYGPHSESAAKNPMSDAANAWQRLLLSDIIPNNRALLMLVRRNQMLLNPTEREVIEQFRIHAEALEFNHLSGDKNNTAPIFPKAMNDILK